MTKICSLLIYTYVSVPKKQNMYV